MRNRPAELVEMIDGACADEEIERLTGANLSEWKLMHLQHMLDVARSIYVRPYRMPLLPIDRNGAGC